MNLNEKAEYYEAKSSLKMNDVCQISEDAFIYDWLNKEP